MAANPPAQTARSSEPAHFPQPTVEITEPNTRRGLRRVTQLYPFRNGAYAFNNLLGRLGFDKGEPRWVHTPATEHMPTMVLNISSRHERKIYLFPKAYGRDYQKAPLASFLRRVLKPGHHFFEIGANVGYYAILARDLVGPEGRIYAFEPDPLTCETLRRTLAANDVKAARAIQLALADQNGTLTFHRGKNNPSSSLVPEDPNHLERYTGSIDVAVRRLDDWVVEEKVPLEKIGAIKVDVEGAEVSTVGGMLGTLERAGRPPLFVEVRGPKGSTRAPNTFTGVLGHVEKLGYKPYRWNGAAVGPIAPESVIHREDIVFLCDGHSLG